MKKLKIRMWVKVVIFGIVVFTISGIFIKGLCLRYNQLCNNGNKQYCEVVK